MRNWLEVDEDGLAQTLEARGKAFALFELVQNAWDERATKVGVTLEPVPGRPLATLKIQDNSPDGWVSLDHAWTCFAPSYKKGDPRKRGRWNWGEKLVLVMCEKAVLRTMNGTVLFDGFGRNEMPRQKTEEGTEFEAVIRMTREEYAEVCAKMKTLIAPEGVDTFFNHERIAYRVPMCEMGQKLPTVLADEEGNLRRTIRHTRVWLYDPLPGETAMIYEMGIPIVETGDRWHVSVDQKVPMNSDRNNVPPAYLRKIRALALNATHELLDTEDATAPWAQEAAGSPEAQTDAVKSVLDKQFGERRVMYDPSDPEGSKIAVSKGYTLVHGRSVPKGIMENVRKWRDDGADLLKPAGQVTPSPKPYDPEGDPVPQVEPDEFMMRVSAYAQMIALALLQRPIHVRFVRAGRRFSAAYGPGCLDFNVSSLGAAWFKRACTGHEGLTDLDELLVHEFAHEHSNDHLSERFHTWQARLGARLARLGRDKGVALRP